MDCDISAISFFSFVLLVFYDFLFLNCIPTSQFGLLVFAFFIFSWLQYEERHARMPPSLPCKTWLKFVD